MGTIQRTNGSQPTGDGKPANGEGKRERKPTNGQTETSERRRETRTGTNQQADGNQPSGGGRLSRGAALGRPPPPTANKCPAYSVGQPRSAAACLPRTNAHPCGGERGHYRRPPTAAECAKRGGACPCDRDITRSYGGAPLFRPRPQPPHPLRARGWRS